MLPGFGGELAGAAILRRAKRAMTNGGIGFSISLESLMKKRIRSRPRNSLDFGTEGCGPQVRTAQDSHDGPQYPPKLPAASDSTESREDDVPVAFRTDHCALQHNSYLWLSGLTPA